MMTVRIYQLENYTLQILFWNLQDLCDLVFLTNSLKTVK